MKGRREAKAVGELVASALRDLGVPSKRLSRRVEAAWTRAADPGWAGKVVPLRLVGGLLVIGVTSSALRQELTQFHRDRLLSVLRAALPDMTLTGLRFTAETPGRADPGSTESRESDERAPAGDR